MYFNFGANWRYWSEKVYLRLFFSFIPLFPKSLIIGESVNTRKQYKLVYRDRIFFSFCAKILLLAENEQTRGSSEKKNCRKTSACVGLEKKE